MEISEIVNGAIGAFPDHCAGYLNPGASGLGYIATLTLSVGKVKADMDIGLEGIVSYDRCEADDAYIGQINMLTASSFCGLNGAVWGYDIARADDLTDTRLSTLRRHDGIDIPVYSAKPLLDAAYRLFGSQAQRRFNLLPGAMVVCANKNWTMRAPPGKTTTVWCAIALAIAEDRTKDANLFIEDASDTVTTGPRSLDDLVQNIAQSILRCGKDQGVLYKEIFVAHKSIDVDEGTIGCALTCAPYVTLPKRAIPSGKPASALLDMTISKWESELELAPLPSYSDYPG
jgi:histidine decarboxylase